MMRRACAKPTTLYGHRNFDTQALYQAGINLRQQDVYYGEQDKVELGSQDITVTFLGATMITRLRWLWLLEGLSPTVKRWAN